MIGVSSSGRRFAGLARYLAVGRTGKEHDRVAWSEGRHVPTDEPRLAGHIMQATARQNPQVKEPVYHLSISFDPRDTEKATPELMRGVADRLLRDMNLHEHQALIVAHRDREHTHMHIMVNRVHPETLHAWDQWRDYAVMQRSLREQERALELTEVRGRLYRLPGQEMPSTGHLTRGEVRQQARGELPFFERARARAGDLREATSWDDLQARLAVHGMCAERKGQGLVIRDEDHQVKASRVGRDVSMKQLEERLGPYVESSRALVFADTPSGHRTVRGAVEHVRQLEQIRELEMKSYHASNAVQVGVERLKRLEWRVERTQACSREFDRALKTVYHDPAQARQQFETMAKQHGWSEATRMVSTRPEVLGTLAHEIEQSRWGFNSLTDTAARERVPDVIRAAQPLGEATKSLADQVKGVTGVSSAEADALANAFAQAREGLKVAEAAAVNVRAERAKLPTEAELGRHIEHALASLAPRELRQLMTLLKDPQRAIVQHIVQRAREMVMSREGPAYS